MWSPGGVQLRRFNIFGIITKDSDATFLPEMRHTGCASFAPANIRRAPAGALRNLSLALPALPNALGNQCLGFRRLEVCALPALLPSGIEHVERAVLQAASLDGNSVAEWRYSLPVSSLPLQLREFPALQGQV
jgi:hypothetical protein